MPETVDHALTRLCLFPVCRFGEVDVFPIRLSRNASQILAKTKSVTSYESVSSGWSKSLVSLEMSIAFLYDSC